MKKSTIYENEVKRNEVKKHERVKSGKNANCVRELIRLKHVNMSE